MIGFTSPSSSAVSGVSAALFPHAMSNPTPLGEIALSYTITPPIGHE